MRIDRIKLISELARRDMTQTMLAELSGVSRSTISYVCGGKSCSDNVGNSIADALDVKIEKLLEK